MNYGRKPLLMAGYLAKSIRENAALIVLATVELGARRMQTGSATLNAHYFAFGTRHRCLKVSWCQVVNTHAT